MAQQVMAVQPVPHRLHPLLLEEMGEETATVARTVAVVTMRMETQGSPVMSRNRPLTIQLLHSREGVRVEDVHVLEGKGLDLILLFGEDVVIAPILGVVEPIPSLRLRE